MNTKDRTGVYDEEKIREGGVIYHSGKWISEFNFWDLKGEIEGTRSH